jgi:DnaJ-class molecular chaperone
MPVKTLYELLEVPANVDQQGLKRAYRRLARRFHPDRNNNNPACAAAMQALNAAYEVLSDRAKRQAYDRGLVEQSRQAAQAAPAAAAGTETPPKAPPRFRVNFGEAAEILERCGGDLVDFAAKKGRDKVAEQIGKKVTIGPRGSRVLEEIANLGAETAKEGLAKWLKKSS